MFDKHGLFDIYVNHDFILKYNFHFSDITIFISISEL